MASTREWFETVAEAQRRAERRLPRGVYLALVAGAEQGFTIRDNVAAFSELRFEPPHIADLPAVRAMSTSVLGEDISLPVIASPTGVQAVHPDGEVAVARGTAAAGTAIGLSSFASMPVEDVAAANPKLFFQTYWAGSRDSILERAERARHAGAKALIVTLDWSFSNGRDWGSPWIPDKLDLRAIMRYAPQGVLRPRYVLDYLRHGGLPDLTVPNMADPGQPAPTFFERLRPVDADPAPVVVRHRLAARALGRTVPREGRHASRRRPQGGRHRRHRHLRVQPRRQQPRRHPAAIRALPAVVAAVDDHVEILLDGGIRRGSDVVKALALGADAVMIGRAYLWGLAANGSAGVTNVFDILRGGIDSTLLALGRASIHDLVPDDVIAPHDFTDGLEK